MKILITGANGFLGSVLLNQMQKTNHKIFPLVRKSKGVNDIECDIGNTRSLLTILNKYRPNVIVNCAAKVDFSERPIQDQYNVNALAPAVIASWCMDNKAYLIQISSSIVNGNTLVKSGVNSMELPINYYGVTKLLADRAIRVSQCEHAIIRFGGIYGEDGPNHLGINSVITQAKLGNIPTIIGKGKGVRNYTHVQDAAKSIVYCIDNNIMGTHYSGSYQSISIAQMISDICSIYLDNSKPKYKDGLESIDQITEVSSNLPKTKLFKEALQDYR